MKPGQVATKAVETLSPSLAQGREGKFPVALGLGLGAVVSLGLWAGVIAGLRALFF